ncbi:MAG: glycosyltransferase family 2 protein [Candidatus Acidiferrales bacterium]
MGSPFFTVLVDTYNHEAFIQDAIESILNQDFPIRDIEVLVVDDGSADRTAEIVRTFEPRVKLLRKANGGQASAFNLGIPEARGEVIAFLDGDDWWERDKLSRVANAFADHPSLGLVGHGIVEVSLDGRHSVYLDREERFCCTSREGAKLFRTRKNFLGTSRMAIRRKLANKIVPVPECLTFEADEYLFTMACILSEAMVLAQALTFYRLHDGNLFQVGNGDLFRVRGKLAVLGCLFRSLATELGRVGVNSDIVDLILAPIETEASQIRLALENRPPWETLSTEWRLLRIHHEDASFWQRAYTAVRLFPAVMMSSKTYYRCRRQIVENRLYRALRHKILPFPGATPSLER